MEEGIMKQLWVIVKGFITFMAFATIVTGVVVYVISTKSTAKTLNEDVVPQLKYLVRAEQTNRERDSIFDKN